MSKRMRRDTRVIRVDDIETANRIREYCMTNLMDDKMSTVYGTVYVTNDRAVDSKVHVNFRCTAKEWRRVLEHYELARSSKYSVVYRRYDLVREKSQRMIVRAVWEFEADVSDLDPKFIDIPGLAKDMAMRELGHLMDTGELSAADFTYEIMEEKV